MQQHQHAFLELATLLDSAIAFGRLNKKAKIDSLTPLIAYNLLKLFKIKIILPLAEYSPEQLEEVYHRLARVQLIEFDSKHVVQKGQYTCIYAVLVGAVKQFSKLDRSPTLLEDRLGGVEKADDPVLLIDEEGPIRCLKRVTALKLDYATYFDLAQTVRKKQQNQLLKFLSECLKVPSSELIGTRLLKEIEFLQIKQGEILDWRNSERVLVVKWGRLELKYVKTSMKMVLSRGSVMRQSDCEQCIITGLEASLLISLRQKLLTQLGQQIKGFKRDFKESCDYVQKARLSIITRCPSAQQQQPESQFTYSYANMKINRRSSTKRFRTSGIMKPDCPFKQFITNLPYEQIVDSQVYLTGKSKMRVAQKGQKIMTYLKINQLKRKKRNDKMLYLRMKSVVEKAMAGEHRNSKAVFRDPTASLKFNIFESSTEEQPAEKEAYFAENDTGLIHQFVKESRVYQKELNNLIAKGSQKRKRVKTEESLCPRNMLQEMRTDYTGSYNDSILKQSDTIKTIRNTFESSNNLYNDFMEFPAQTMAPRATVKTMLKQLKSGKVVKIRK